MNTSELENDEASKKSKAYFLSSLLIIIVFVGVNLIGYFLNIINLITFMILFLIFFILTIIIIVYSNRLETVYIEKWGRRFRKYSHLTGGVLMIGFCIMSSIYLSWICFSIFIIFLLHECFYVKMNISGVYTKTLIFVGRLERNQNESSEEPKFFYPTLWILASISVIGLFGQMIAIAAVIVFALGDSFSTIIGERIGNHKLPYNKTKSIEGTLIFFVISFLGVFCAYLVAGQLSWLPALISGLIGSIIESIIPTNFWLDDNFAAPVSVGIVLYFTKMIQ